VGHQVRLPMSLRLLQIKFGQGNGNHLNIKMSIALKETI